MPRACVLAEFTDRPCIMSSKVLIVATMPWPSAARLAGAFAGIGWTADALAPAGASVHRSRFARTVRRHSAFAPLAALARAIAECAPDLVVPCDDRAVRQLIALHDACTDHGDDAVAALIARSLGKPEHYGALMSRAQLMAAAAAAGIAVPATRSIASLDDLDTALAAVGLPAVLKADGSWAGDGVAVVHTREEAYDAFRRMARPLPPLRALLRSFKRRDAHHVVEALAAPAPVLSVQQFVSGALATTSFAAWQGEVAAAIHLDVAVSCGRTGPASVVRCVDDPVMAEAARTLARMAGLSGFHGLDFIRDGAGKVHLLEINPRATQTAALALGEGKDLVAGLAARAAAAAVPARRAIGDAGYIALFPQEWTRDPASPHLANAYHDVPWDDPAVLRQCLDGPGNKALADWRAKQRRAASPLRHSQCLTAG